MHENRLILVLAATLALPSVALAGPKFNASSSYETSSEGFGPEKAFDGLLTTAWAEDAVAAGLQEWLEVDLGADREIRVISIWGGRFGGQEQYDSHSRLRSATLLVTGPDAEISKELHFADRLSRLDVDLGKKTKVRKIKIRIDEVYPGSVFQDTYISELAFDFAADFVPEMEEGLTKTIQKSRNLREAAEKVQQQQDDAYDGAKGNVDYSDNFKIVAWMAAHGPDYRIEAVQKAIPVGYRLQFLGYDEDAVVRLGKLKDPNAIKYLEIAAAGALDEDAEWLLGIVRRFGAYADLRRSSRTTIPNWGFEGMEKGAFQSRGEPLAIDIDSAGNIWVADVGNNRIQRFSPAGSCEQVIGAKERGVVESWFGDKSAPYAAGAVAGTEKGQFTQPVYLAVGNYDILAVIDAQLRVQTFGEESALLGSWTIDANWKPKAAIGMGSPIISWLGDDFYFLIGDQVFVYNPTGELQKNYSLEGGKVQAAVIANKRLLVRHQGSNDIIEYSPADGFRQGIWSKKGVPEDGSSDWDLATDENDNVYVLTDAGNLHIWNKRGKFIKTVQVFGNARDVPRLTVSGGFAYITAKDAIHRIDLEL